MAPTFAEISEQLSKALAIVSEKKLTLDKLTAEIQKANAEYSDAVSNASSLKDMMTAHLADALPNQGSSRVR